MRARIIKLAAALSALAALAFGGATLASASSKASPPPAQSPVEEVAAPDGDQIQQGDQSTPDTAASEQHGSQQETTPEQPESASAESGSEEVAGDGPGSHADEPANADDQFQGAE
jgi:hypothetical protein